ncbi:DUF2806 domain-containing protein [Microvirga sp. BT291]|nr:DUF2806 domain-containing protein [Microvirga pudoricolor]
MGEDLKAATQLMNLRSVVRMAEDELDSGTNTSTSEPKSEASEDWIFQWREGAERTSSEDMQRLWARLLAGEVKQSGSFSLRTLSFVRTLDQYDAQLIARLAPFSIQGGWIAKYEAILGAAGLGFRELQHLEDLGLIIGIGGIGMRWRTDVTPPGPSLYVFHDNQAIRYESDSGTVRVEQPSMPLTRLGQEVLKLGSFTAPAAYIQALADDLKQKGLRVSRSVVEPTGDGAFFIVSTSPL